MPPLVVAAWQVGLGCLAMLVLGVVFEQQNLYERMSGGAGDDIVSGDEGLDELSLAGGNEVAVVTGNAAIKGARRCPSGRLRSTSVEPEHRNIN